MVDGLLGNPSFRKAFKTLVGISPGEYRRQRKMEKAQRRLVAREQSVTEIAAELGYLDQGAFSRAFRPLPAHRPRYFVSNMDPVRVDCAKARVRLSQ